MSPYKAVSNRPNLNSIEEEVLNFWKTEQIFKQVLESRKQAPEFTFYEGPPTANGKPGVHHVLARTFKDIVCRYQTMQGKLVTRQAGWDEHGLPVEIEVQKTHTLKSKTDIEALGIGKFNQLCAASTQKYIGEWEELTERMAYWVDFNKAYKTSDPKYVERIWGVLKTLFNKQLLYKGFKIIPWACDSGTVVSQAEVALGYKDVIDESAYVKFELTDESSQKIKANLQLNNLDSNNKFYMLAWTTTPWTLPSNMALAIGSEIEYVICGRETSPPTPLREQRGAQEVSSWQTPPELWEKLKPLAQQMRIEPTQAEELLWSMLRDRQLNNAKFRRQHSIDRFIVDFYCAEAKLIIEADGKIHEYSEEQDAIRQEFLENLGYRVLRFSNEKILNSTKQILEEITKALAFPDCPPLSAGGEGPGVRSEYIIISRKRYATVLNGSENDWQEIGHLKGQDLLDHKTEYLNLFSGKAQPVIQGLNTQKEEFVIDDEKSGTGIVHIAPAFGQDDFEAYKANNIQEEITNAVNPDGSFNSQAPEFLKGESIFNENKKTGQQEFVRINKIVCKHLDEKGLLLKTEKYEHSYPHNWRTNNPLIYYLRPSWYVATGKLKEQLIEANQQVNWVPEHIKEGRFGQWLENNVDWAISRERYWGTPLPIWIGETSGKIVVIGSLAELAEKTGLKEIAQTGFNPHRPFVDEISWTENGETFKRVPEVLDCWFDSGAMPYASQETPRQQADYICEAVDQTRGWFYSLLAVSVAMQSQNLNTLQTGLEQEAKVIPPYKNVLCLGHILDKDGQKMSKSKGNVINPWDLFNQFGADPVRWFMITAVSAGQPIRFDEAGINEVMRRFVLPLWNTYAFYILYANLEKVNSESLLQTPGELIQRQLKPIDLWIIARLNETQIQVTDEFNKYEFSKAALAIEKFVDDLSNIWVRANRSRFWNTSNQNTVIDAAAYQTLQTCLLSVARMVAPCMPLLSDALYQNLKEKQAPQSIHLCDWIQGESPSELEQALLNEMAIAQNIINQGRSLRQELKLKIRQPLQKIVVSQEPKIKYFEELICTELNVKKVEYADTETNSVKLETQLTPELLAEGLAREFIHSIQNLRKASGFEVDDRIELFVNFPASESEFPGLLRTQKNYILSEVLALSWKEEIQAEQKAMLSSKNIKLNGYEMEVSIHKVSQ